MKRRLFIGLVVGTMCVGLVGCGGNSSNTGSDVNGSSASVSTESESVSTESESDTETEETSSEESTLSNADMSKILLTGIGKMLPDPSEYFSGKLDGGDHGDSLIMWIEDTTIDEFNAYMDKCKDAGFTKVDNSGADESGIIYWAYTEDGKYYLDLFYSTSDKTTEIQLDEVKEK